jgi:hypothetical protein
MFRSRLVDHLHQSYMAQSMVASATVEAKDRKTPRYMSILKFDVGPGFYLLSLDGVLAYTAPQRFLQSIFRWGIDTRISNILHGSSFPIPSSILESSTSLEFTSAPT